MYNLIRKDFLLMKKMFWLIVPYLCFLALALFNTRENLFLGGVYTSFILLIMTTSFDIKSKTNVLLGSLPIRRKDIVVAKYAIGLIYAVAGAVASMLIGLLYQIAIGQADPFDTFIMQPLIAFTVATCFAALYLPLYYWLSEKGAQVINAVFVGIMVLSGSTAGIARYFILKYQLIANMNAISGVAVLLSLVLLCISYTLAKRLFTRKDI